MHEIKQFENRDRNFDTIADHFAKKVYGGLKGDIRLAVLRRDLLSAIQSLSEQKKRPLKILDIGAGLAQLSQDLVRMGHQVTVNDISEKMLNKAKAEFIDQSSVDNHQYGQINWIVCPYQQLDAHLTVDSFDVILCHALLEWLSEPQDVISFSKKWLCNGGLLSLCFYNPASFVYRNLMMGNFNVLDNAKFRSDNVKSLTPNNPVAKEDVFIWLKDAEMNIAKVSGLRVFYDYTVHKRGGLSNSNAIIEMEIRYSDQEPYKWMGRYLHVMATMND